ncbi:hypothetical protein ACPVPU_07370 [Sphingomonas sp. CJ99]
MVETRTLREMVCPAELTAPLPDPIPMPEGAAITGDEASLDYVGRRFAREEQLEQRIIDGRSVCP